MIGGIFAEMVLGSTEEVTLKLLSKDAPVKVKRIDHYLDKLIGERKHLDWVFFTKEEIASFLVDISYQSVSRRISAKHRRDFEDWSGDLLRSMGVIIYHNGKFQTSRRFEGGKATGPKKHKENPDTRFTSFGYGYASRSLSKGGRWTVCYVATMPYAVRLEHKPVQSTSYSEYRTKFVNGLKAREKVSSTIPSGGYNKRVLIGQFHTLMGQFIRDFGRASLQTSPRVVDSYQYGYVFETRDTGEIIEAG